MSGGTYSRLGEVLRILNTAEQKMHILHGRISPAVADQLMGAGNKLAEIRQQVQAAAQVARDELYEEAAQ